MTPTKFVISNDLWTTEVGEYVTCSLLGIPPKYKGVEYKVQKPSALPGENRFVNSNIWTFELRMVLLNDRNVTLWKRIA